MTATKLISFLLITLPLISIAQNKPKSGKPYLLWLQTTDSQNWERGFLHSLTDSSIIIHKSWYVKPREKQAFHVEQIKWVGFRRQGKVLEGVGIGAALGLATGMIWGLALGDDPPCHILPLGRCIPLTGAQKGFFISLSTVTLGAFVGGLVGGKRTKITLDGKRSEYARQRKRIESYRR